MYGSQARDEAKFHSDVDIAILLKKKPPPTLDGIGLDLGADIEMAIGKPVDLVILNRAPADLIHRILRDGIIVYERAIPAPEFALKYGPAESISICFHIFVSIGDPVRNI